LWLPKERAAAIGARTGVVGLAVALGSLSGGLLLKHFWWGSIFFVNLPIAARSASLLSTFSELGRLPPKARCTPGTLSAPGLSLEDRPLTGTRG